MISNKPLRQESFDTLKCFLAFLVVILHSGFTDYIGGIVNSFSRIAVPLFFMITGYYLPMMTETKFSRYFYKIIRFTVISTLFYFLFGYVCSIVNKNSFGYITQIFETKKICYWVLFNADPTSDHLWYFYALIYTLIIIYIARKVKKMHSLYSIIPILFLGNYVLSYNEYIFYRNFLFIGLPYVLLGCIFRNHEKNIVNIFHRTQTLIWGFIIMCIGLGVEIFAYKVIGVKIVRDHFLFTLPMVVCVFILVLKHPHWRGGILSIIGKKYSAYIYIFCIFLSYQ